MPRVWLQFVIVVFTDHTHYFSRDEVSLKTGASSGPVQALRYNFSLSMNTQVTNEFIAPKNLPRLVHFQTNMLLGALFKTEQSPL